MDGMVRIAYTTNTHTDLALGAAEAEGLAGREALAVLHLARGREAPGLGVVSEEARPA